MQTNVAIASWNVSGAARALAVVVLLVVLGFQGGCGARDDADATTEWSATVAPVTGSPDLYYLVLTYKCYAGSGALIEQRQIPQVQISSDKEFHEILGGPTKGSDSYSVTGMLIKGKGKMMLDLRFVSMSSHGQLVVTSILTL